MCDLRRVWIFWCVSSVYNKFSKPMGLGFRLLIPYDSAQGWLQDFKESYAGLVLLGNKKACKILGIGKVSIRMHDGCVRVQHDVRYVLELKRNLLSIGMLDKSGYTIRRSRWRNEDLSRCDDNNEGDTREWPLHSSWKHSASMCLNNHRYERL